ncbi:uncharacterized protein TNCV_3925701 [Trichonephila clavipes]|nr:uncharacterized protein TNCV_3925701 [Trichonephila clavipes]
MALTRSVEREQLHSRAEGGYKTVIFVFIYLSNGPAWPLNHLKLNLPLPSGDIVSRVFIESSALEQVVAIHSAMAAEWAGPIRSQAKSMEVYSPKVMSRDSTKAGNSFGTLQVPRDLTHSIQSFPWFSKLLVFWINECGNNAI